MATHLIIGVSELSSVSFSEVNETQSNIKYSMDGQKFRISWNNDNPSFIDNLTTKEGPYSDEDMVIILTNHEWEIMI